MMKYPIFTATALVLLATGSVQALPEPIACWKADGQAQPEAGTEARTTNALDITYKQGIAGKAFAFNGKTSVIEAAFEWKSASPAATWSVWIRPTESTKQMEILTNDPFTNALYIRNGKIAIYYAGRNLDFGPVKWGVWQHVAVVFAADHVTVYDRSGPSRQAFPVRSTFTQHRLLVGASILSMESNYSGLIDQIAIYDRELTPAEIKELSIRPKESNRDETSKPNGSTPDKSPAKLQQWINLEGKAITAEFVRVDGDAVVVKMGGKEFRIPFSNLAEDSIRRAKTLAAPELADAPPVLIPAAPTTLQIKLASKVTKVDRWGTGNKALVFFSHTGPMNESVVAGINSYEPIFTAGYSIFLWNYPRGKPFSETQKTLQSWMKGENSKLDFAEVATEVVDGIRAQTGIKEFLLVGDSLGAGILLTDYAKLSVSGNVRFVLISPTEPFCPEENDLPIIKNSLLLANSKGDDFVRLPGFGKWIEDQRTDEKITGQIPPGHLILGENLAHKLLVNILADFSKDPLGASDQPTNRANLIQSDEIKQSSLIANQKESLALDMTVPNPPNANYWYWPQINGSTYALGMPSQSKIQYLWGALQITNAQMERLMALWQEIVIQACNEDEKQFRPAVAKFAVERETILTPTQKEIRQRIANYYAELNTKLEAQGLVGEQLNLKAAEQARKELPSILGLQETTYWHTVEDVRLRAEKAAKQSSNQTPMPTK